mmetsp:Transcript_2539/g.4057  ORF Transcript_2539/g.4057 Transcript_2539/m.4057 type:complete len:1460 (+) Transcript_2539:76-4455(+)
MAVIKQGALTWPDTLSHVKCIRRRSLQFMGFGMEYAPFIILYGIALQWCWNTSGEPYAAAIAHEAAKKAAKFVGKNVGFAQAEIFDDEDEDAPLETDFANGAVPAPPPSRFFDVTNSTAIEEAMRAKEQPLPNPMLPNFWAVLFVAIIFIFHCLVWFIQRWSIRVRVKVQYQNAPVLEEGAFAFITPHLHQGAAAIVPIHVVKIAGTTQRFCVFQRQKYEIDETGTVITELEMPDQHPLKHYQQHSGYASGDEIQCAYQRYGYNSLHIELPTFKESFVKQILGPVPVFQFFCASLWLLDEYWNYALFQLFSICMYESSTVFGKIKNMQALKGVNKASIFVKVYREKVWKDMAVTELLPGDILSLFKGEGDMTVPCDALILRGSMVVNEAALTGESVPQMKEGAAADGAACELMLDVEKEHRVHMLYGGTTIMQHNSPVQEGGALTAPDGGCICYCVRTGFSSSEGKLVRMIEFSQEQVLTDAKEVLSLLALLLFFALIASGHVLHKGLKEGKRSQYELILRCVLILTSAVPPELPMQTAVAVNAAVFTLFRAQVFCTEPFRIPFAGKIEYCLFDKTGTLTTDKLVCAGTWRPGLDPCEPPTSLANTSKECAMVLGSCHALVQVGEQVMGDPVEMASMQALGWEYDPKTQTSTPGEKAQVCKPGEVTAQVLHRYHFASKLQRMAVLATVREKNCPPRHMALVKGSPEIIATLLTTKPEGYDLAYREMAERGMRVLALASRTLTSSEEDTAKRAAASGRGPAREEIEQGLKFEGFVAFVCKVRRDSAEVVASLRQSSHHVAMATGDSALTAVFVGTEVGITHGDKTKELLLEISESGVLQWAVPRGVDKAAPRPFVVKEVEDWVDKGFDLCVTGSSLQAAVAEDEAFWGVVKHVKIWARMSPEDKEAVLRALKEQGYHTLMCGDGANDVGALKQAHVGVALLSGFGGANTAKDGEKTSIEESDQEKRVRMWGDWQKMQEKQKKMQAEHKTDTEAMKKWQMDRYQVLLTDMTSRGVSYAPFKALSQAAKEARDEMNSRAIEKQKKTGGTNGFTAHAAMMLSPDDMETGGAPQIKLGDASVAAPFTSKLPSIKSTVDIIRQGRCTLVSTIQMQQVLALECLITAYSMSALYLDGVSKGENQMMATGILLMFASVAFSYARPVEKLSPCRPITTIFHPAIWVSIVGQLLIHLGGLMYIIQLTRDAVSAEESAVLDGYIEEFDDDSWVPPPPPPPPAPNATLNFFGDTESFDQKIKFKPSLLNTVVFLVQTAQQVAVMAVNYKGRPFMLAATENAAMGASLFAVGSLVFACAFEVVPQLNTLLKLVPLPSSFFRQQILVCLGMSVFGSMLWDRLCVAIFAPKLLWVGYVDAWEALPAWRVMFYEMSKYVYLAGVMVAYSYTEQSLMTLLGGWYLWRQIYGQKPPLPPPGVDAGPALPAPEPETPAHGKAGVKAKSKGKQVTAGAM